MDEALVSINVPSSSNSLGLTSQGSKETGERMERRGGADYSAWSDLALVAKIKEESSDAYAELYRRHARAVFASARLILGKESDLDDIVAEVFISLWFSSERFDPRKGSLVGFLRMAARGRSIDFLRQSASREVREEVVERAGRELAPDLDEGVLHSESAKQLRTALASLPSHLREPIYLAFYSEMSYPEVAAHLSLPVGTVKSRIRAGLVRLRKSAEVNGLLSERDQGRPVTVRRAISPHEG
jgi:RNA polymerase sigma-70 factor, ECF subfamily